MGSAVKGAQAKTKYQQAYEQKLLQKQLQLHNLQSSKIDNKESTANNKAAKDQIFQYFEKPKASKDSFKKARTAESKKQDLKAQKQYNSKS